MKEYISKEYLNRIIKSYIADARGAEYYAYNCLTHEIQCTPDSEIIHLNQATWEHWAGNLLRCPVCGYEYTDLLECHNFCGNCGAMMREEKNNE
jgi:hypothetical protein